MSKISFNLCCPSSIVLRIGFNAFAILTGSEPAVNKLFIPVCIAIVKFSTGGVEIEIISSINCVGSVTSGRMYFLNLVLVCDASRSS